MKAISTRQEAEAAADDLHIDFYIAVHPLAGESERQRAALTMRWLVDRQESNMALRNALGNLTLDCMGEFK